MRHHPLLMVERTKRALTRGWPNRVTPVAGVSAILRARNGVRAVLVALFASACGYHAVYGGASSERLHVALARAPVADAIAAGEVVSGVREELAREGALAGGEGYPRVEVEVTRLDESSDAVAVATSADGTARVPRARATEVGVVARAWLVVRAGAQPERDTGDVRVQLVTAAPAALAGPGGAGAAASDSLRHDDAIHAAARRVGTQLAKRILGEPAPEGDGIGRGL